MDPMSLLSMFTGPGGNSPDPNKGMDGALAGTFANLAEKIPVAGPLAAGGARLMSKGVHGVTDALSAPIDALVGAIGGAARAPAAGGGGLGVPSMAGMSGPAGLPPLPPASSAGASPTGGSASALPQAMGKPQGAQGALGGSPLGALSSVSPSPFVGQQATTGPMPPQSASDVLRNQAGMNDPAMDPLRKRQPMGPF